MAPSLPPAGQCWSEASTRAKTARISSPKSTNLASSRGVGNWLTVVSAIRAASCGGHPYAPADPAGKAIVFAPSSPAMASDWL